MRLNQSGFWTRRLTTLALLAALCAAPGVARAIDPVGEASVLLGKVCSLRTAIESYGHERFAIRSAAQLETSVQVLLEKLACPHDFEPITCAVRDVQLFAERTLVAVESSCHLREDRIVMLELDCVLRQFTRLQLSVDRLASLGPAPLVPTPTWFGAPSIGHGQPHGQVHGPAIDPRFAGTDNPFGARGGFGSELSRTEIRVTQLGVGNLNPHAHPGDRAAQFGFSSPAAASRGGRVVARPEFGAPFGGQFAAGSPLPGQFQGQRAFPSDSRGFPGDRVAGPQAGNGEIGRAILGLLMSQMGR